MQEKNKLTDDYLKTNGFEVLKTESVYSARRGNFKIQKGYFDKLHTWQYTWINMATEKCEVVDVLTKSHLRQLFFSLYRIELESKS